MARPEDKLVGRVFGGKFEIEAHIGSGAMGQVFRARQIALQKTVALKVLHADLAGDDTFAARFHREAMAASRLDHPNSMRVIDFGSEPDGMLYIAMEFLDGRDLHRIFYEEHPLPNARIVDILSQALAALVVAHDMGVIHRDVKPENIMILAGADDEGNRTDLVKVCDFGIAKISGQTLAGARSDPSRGPLTTQGLVVGTPEYMSPEQGKGDALDARSDLYSVGVILFQLLTGELPFKAETALGLVFKQVNDAPPRPASLVADVHPGLEAVCLKALSKRPVDRFQTAREMRSALRAALGDVRTTPSVRSAPPDRVGAFERAETEDVQLSDRPPAPAATSTSSQVGPRTSTGTATLFTVPVTQPNVWVLGGAALLVGAGLTALGAMQWSSPRPMPADSSDSAAHTMPSAAPVEAAAPAVVAAASASSSAKASTAAVPTHVAHGNVAAPPHATKPPAPSSASDAAAPGAPPTAAFSLTTSSASPTVTRASGVAAADVRAALPSWKFTQCYRTALEHANKPLDGHITLALTMDGTGAVTRVAVRGSGALLTGTGDCMIDALGHVTVANAAPAGSTADVDVACVPH